MFPSAIVCLTKKHCLCNAIKRRKCIEFVINNLHLKPLNTKGRFSTTDLVTQYAEKIGAGYNVAL